MFWGDARTAAALEPGDVATWVTAAATWAGAIATSGALWLAIWGVQNERRLRRASEKEEAERARRSQADGVFAWYGGWGVRAGLTSESDFLIVRNASDLPVYDAVVSLVLVQGAGPTSSEELAELANTQGGFTGLRRETFVIPPGTWRFSVSEGWGGMMKRAGAEVAFRDAGGNFWIRRANGALEELADAPFDHLAVPLPISDYQLERG